MSFGTLRVGIALLLSLVLTGCMSAPEASRHGHAAPLALESFFPGRSEGDGVFVNSWTGNERRFHVVILGTWDGTTLTLVEDFTYADGEKDRKTWVLRRTGPGVFSGTREDVVGAARVWTDGPVVHLSYKVRLGGWTVDFLDTLALQGNDVLLNRAAVGKWGIRLGRVELTIRKSTN